MKAAKIALWFLLIAQFVALLSPDTLDRKLLHAALFALALFGLIAIHKKTIK